MQEALWSAVAVIALVLLHGYLQQKSRTRVAKDAFVPFIGTYSLTHPALWEPGGDPVPDTAYTVVVDDTGISLALAAGDHVANLRYPLGEFGTCGRSSEWILGLEVTEEYAVHGFQHAKDRAFLFFIEHKPTRTVSELYLCSPETEFPEGEERVVRLIRVGSTGYAGACWKHTPSPVPHVVM